MHDNRTQQVEEQMLVRKAQQGDAQIFSLLVNKYQRRLTMKQIFLDFEQPIAELMSLIFCHMKAKLLKMAQLLPNLN